jgi:hypothetical protein
MSLSPNEVASRQREERRFGRQLITGDGCESGKRTWTSKAQAKRALKKARRMQQTKGEGDSAVVSIYECRSCGAWHMTKHPARHAA